jgi:hypothetical protein
MLEKLKNSNIQYYSIIEGLILQYNKDTNIFTFKGIEITADEAINLCNSMSDILLKHAQAKPEDWHFIVGSCPADDALEDNKNKEAPLNERN